MAQRPGSKRKSSSSSFRGAREAREPGIQRESSTPRLDSGSGADAPARNDRTKVRVARIGAAHGIRGEVRLWSFTEDPGSIAEYGPLETEDGARRFKIEALRPAKDHFVARLTGIEDRTAAEALRNVDLFVPRDRLPPIETDDTFYYADLIGLAAVSRDGATIGTVSAVHNFGAGDIIEIAPATGGTPLMLSFTATAVPEVDLAARRLVVVMPEETVVPAERSESRDP